jgi:hypothetical protein
MGFHAIVRADTVEQSPPETTKGATLFVVSVPPRSIVQLDNVVLDQRTPAILRDLEPGAHRLVVAQPRFGVSVVEIEVGAEDTRVVTVDLVGTPAADGGRVDRQDVARRRAFTATIPILVVSSGLLTLNDMTYRKESGLFFSPITLSSYAVTAAVIGLRLALGVKPSDDPESTESQARWLDPGEKLYARAQSLLADDRLSEALVVYRDIVGGQPDSQYVPYSLYRIGRIHELRDEEVLAAYSFRLIVDHYPVPDLYDRSLRTLARLAENQGDFAGSLAYLDRMVGIDPLYPPEEIMRIREEVRRRGEGP